MKAKALFLILFISFCFLCKAQEKVNTIIGVVEGLKADDTILVIQRESGEWKIIDRVRDIFDDRFTYSTSLTDVPLLLYYLPAGIEPNLEKMMQEVVMCEVFLEGYSELFLTGSADTWEGLYPEGGLYSLPAMQEINKIRKEEGSVLARIRILRQRALRENDNERWKEVEKEMRKAMDLASKALPPGRVFFRAHPDLAYFAYLLSADGWLKGVDPEEYEAQFNRFTPRVRATLAGIKVAEQLEKIKTTGVGAVLADFDLPSLTGERVRLSHYRGKYIVLEFWGSWCPPCRQTSPQLVKLYDQFRHRNDFAMIGIACKESGEDNWRKAVEDDGLKYIQLIDKDQPDGISVMSAYNILGVPECFFLDPDGKVLFRGHPGKLIPQITEFLEKTE